MTVGKSKLAVFLLTLSIIGIILKLLISYLFPLSRLLLYVIIPTIVILAVIFMVKNRKTLFDKRILTCWLIPLAALIFCLLPIDRQLELARFHVSESFYNSTVQEVRKSIDLSEDTSGRYYMEFPQAMLNPVYAYADYYKKGDSVAIVFPASESLSIVRYYAYFSDSKARELFAHPRGSGDGGFDRVDDLENPHWSYVFTWGSGSMVPKDPNL